MKIKKITKVSRNDEETYNLEVEDNHNYIANDVLVSNCHQLGKGNKVSKFVRKLPTFMKFGFTGTLPEWPPSRWNVIGLLGAVLKVKRAKELQDAGHIAGCDLIGLMFSHREKPKIPEEIMEVLRLAKLDGTEELIELAKLEVAKAQFPAEWHHIEDCDWTNRFMVRMMNAYPGNTILLYDHVAHGHRLKEILEEIEKDKQIFLIEGATPLDDREDVRSAMEISSDCFLLGNTKCIGVGVSIKNIDNIGFGFSSGNAATKIIQAIGRGLRLMEGKTKVRITDFYHDFRYSKDHFGKRLGLYEKHYGITRDGLVYKVVDVPLPRDRVDSF